MKQPRLTASLLLLGSTQAFTSSSPRRCTPRYSFDASLSTKTRVLLQAWNDHDKGRTASYTDDWLLDLHNSVQGTKQLLTNTMTPYNAKLEEEAVQSSITEWQEAFQRNGLADFTPPMTAVGMNCLMVGGDIDAPNPNQRNHFQTKLPWEDEAEAEVTNLMVVMDVKSNDDDEAAQNTAIIPIQTKLVVAPQSSTTSKSSTSSALAVPKEAAVYDCIVDQGLLGSVLDQPEQVKQLLEEAAIALREHGIYVLTTQTLTKQHQTLLTSLTNDCGLEWQFEIDGISDDLAQISVARRFNSGIMPKVGRLSRYQP